MDNQDKILTFLSDEDFNNVQVGLELLESLDLSTAELTELIGTEEDDVFGETGLVENLFLNMRNPSRTCKFDPRA